MFWPEPIASLDRRAIKILELATSGRAGEGHANPVIYQLQRIEVTSRDDRAHLLRFGLPRERAKQIVRLEPIQLVDGNIERRDDITHASKLGAHAIRQRRAMRLVGCKLFMAERWRWAVEGEREIVGLDDAQHVKQ